MSAGRPSRARASAAAALALALAACGADSAPTATPAEGPTLHFTDITAESGLELVLTSGRDPPSQILEVKGGGLALFDLENDGDLDLFAANGATLASARRGPGARLYENRGALRFADASAAAELRFSRWGFGCAAADVDGDGYDDLYVACYGPNALLQNDQGRRLAELPAAAGAAGDDVWSTAAAFGDLDRDGDLDLYVANYLRFDAEHPPAPTSVHGAPVFAGPLGLEPEPDLLYENLGDGRFADRTAASGCGAAPPRFGLGVLVLDLDQDGWQDVYVGNDSQPNFLFLNQGGLRFREIGLESGLALNGEGAAQATMGIALADLGCDGLADIYTTNFANDTNTLHESRGGRAFDDHTALYGLGAPSRPFVGWAAGFFDFDHDADEDLLVFNGHVWPPALTEKLGQTVRQTPLLFERAGPRFARVRAEDAGPWLSAEHCDRSAAFGDLDLDGDIDVVVSERNGPLRLLRNDRDGGAWLVVELADPGPGARNPRGIGARLVLRSAAVVQTRWIHSGGSYQASSAPAAHFALPAGVTELELEVFWPDGLRQRSAELQARTRVRIERGPDGATGR